MQQPPPYSAPSSSTEHQTPTYQAPLPPKAGAPMLIGTPNTAVYVSNPGYPQGVPIGTTTTTRTIVQQQPPAVILTPGIGFREVPVCLQCHVCKTQIVTATEHNPGSLTWLACFGLAAIGCVLGCCFIPFCIDDMKDVVHTCPNCTTVLGIYHRL